jgi:iron complex transport system substrate-binding protein
MELGTMIADIHGMLNGEEEELTYIYKLTSGQ